MGWSNSASITINLAAEKESGLDAACALAAPLDMPASDRHLRQPFHAYVYDRNIATGLADKFKRAEPLFLSGGEVPCWTPGGGASTDRTFVPDLALARNATTIRAIDQAITAPCFGFASVDDYYAYSSPDQRLHLAQVPLLAVNAADDPIARWGPAD
ncbi:MAG: hypothetical protein AAFV01_17890, partial [Bacteroidota bacterium]